MTFPKKILSDFVIFPNLKFFWFLAKNITIKVKKTFSRNNIIWYRLYSQFAGHLQQFWGNSSFKKSYYFSRILWQICNNLVIRKIHIQNRHFAGHWHSEDIINWQVSVKKRRIWVLWGDDFLSMLWIWAENISCHYHLMMGVRWWHWLSGHLQLGWALLMGNRDSQVGQTLHRRRFGSVHWMTNLCFVSCWKNNQINIENAQKYQMEQEWFRWCMMISRAQHRKV